MEAEETAHAHPHPPLAVEEGAEEAAAPNDRPRVFLSILQSRLDVLYVVDAEAYRLFRPVRAFVSDFFHIADESEPGDYFREVVSFDLLAKIAKLPDDAFIIVGHPHDKADVDAFSIGRDRHSVLPRPRIEIFRTLRPAR